MSNLFNTPFETGLRSLLILYVTKSAGMTIDRIVAYDFITIYGKDFGVSEANLHGDNSLNFSELSTKRSVCSEGVKSFVLSGLIGINRMQSGFLYKLTSAGKKYVEAMESDYKDQYVEIVKSVHKKYGRKTDANLIKEINEKAVEALRRQI